MLTRVLGATTFAVSALLTSFMAGLGLGSFLSGRYLTKRRARLYWFGAIELLVGLYAVVLPFILPTVARVFSAGVGSLGLTLYGENILKLGLALGLLLPPTTLMGATLPILSQHFVEHMGHLGVRVGSLYALNTLGATAGCFAAGFYAIPTLGIARTTLAAASINAFVGAGAILLASRGGKAEGRARPSDDTAELTASPYTRRAVRFALLAFAVSGFAGLGFQVIWTRLISLIFKGFTYSFSAMLTVFLAGIALGSLRFGRLADKKDDPLKLFGLLELAIGISVIVLLPLFVPAQGWLHEVGTRLGGDWQHFAAAKFIIAFVLLFIPTFLFGGTFPVVSRLATSHLSALGTTVGNLYAANVAGGIAGAFATGYLLIPLLGTQWSLLLLCFVLMIVGLALISASPSATAGTKRIAAVVVVAVVILVPLIGPGDVSLSIHESWLGAEEKIDFYLEGGTATVMVAERLDTRTDTRDGIKRILVNGSSASNSNFYGQSVNRIQGCLPFIFNRAPRKVLAVCFGTGITFGTLSQFDVERIDAVDISPEVIEAAPAFKQANYDVIHHPRIRIHIDDGRNFLLKTRESYDVITMEPMPPSLAGVVDLYTRDFYELCRERLAPGGVMSQWVPLYHLGLDDLKMLYRTFAESFPHALVFHYNFDTFLVGSDRPLLLSAGGFEERLRSESLLRDLELISLAGTKRMLATFLMDRDAMLRFAGDVPVLTDDLPYVEFTAPKKASMLETPRNYLAVTAFATAASSYLEAASDNDELRAELDEVYAINRQRWDQARARKKELDREREAIYREYERSRLQQ